MKLIDRCLNADVSSLKLTNQELMVYQFITENIDKINTITAKQIAQTCYCTTTTVNRLCKKFGVSGFSDFSAIIGYEVLHQDDSFDRLTTENEEFLIRIDKRKVLFLFGSGPSLFTAKVFERYLLKLGYTVILLEDRYFLKEVMREQILLFSNSGMTAPALDLAYSAKRQGISTFAVTTSGSELDIVCDYRLTFKNNRNDPFAAQLKMHTTLIKIMK